MARFRRSRLETCPHHPLSYGRGSVEAKANLFTRSEHWRGANRLSFNERGWGAQCHIVFEDNVLLAVVPVAVENAPHSYRCGLEAGEGRGCYLGAVAYFLTFSTYGVHLPGDERGSTDRILAACETACQRSRTLPRAS